MVARKLQEEMDQEFLQSLQAQAVTHRHRRANNNIQSFDNIRSSVLHDPIVPISSVHLRNNSRDHSSSLEDALRQINSGTRASSSRHHRNTNSQVRAIHPSHEQDMLNLLARNISSHELNAVSSDNLTSADIPRVFEQRTRATESSRDRLINDHQIAMNYDNINNFRERESINSMINRRPASSSHQDLTYNSRLSTQRQHPETVNLSFTI
jgi:hypothetical protein